MNMQNIKNEIDIEEQKRIQLGILKKFKEVCEKNDINYFLGGGTLLGAIRHKGYIPWDDDIDVMLMRKDYEKLLKVFNNECENSEYRLLTRANTKGHYYPFSKIINVNTEIIEYPCRKIEAMGVYIDIFPIDYLPDDDKKIEKIYRKYRLYNKIMELYKVENIKLGTKNKIKLIVKIPLRFIIEKMQLYKLVLKLMDNLGKKYINTDKVACISGRYFEKEIMSSDYISDYILVDFEGEKYKAPIGYDEYLTKHYGDYMKLPPKEKQISNHDNAAYWKK